MNGARRITASLAAFILICFFLPWVQMSCVGTEDSLSGFDLAREGHRLLWFVPALMLGILIAGLVRWIWEKAPALFAFASTVGGSISAYVMYHERSRMNDSPRLVAMRWTAIFWLAFLASLGIVAAALRFYSKRSRPS